MTTRPTSAETHLGNATSHNSSENAPQIRLDVAGGSPNASLLIDQLHIVKTADTTPAARLPAPIGAPRGSLSPLTQFLQEQGLKVKVDYLSAKKQHILHITGFTSEAALLNLLQEKFILWYKVKRDIGEMQNAPPIAIAPSIECTPLTLETTHTPKDTDHTDVTAQSLRHQIGRLTGLLYGLGNASLMESGLRFPDEEGGTHVNLPRTLSSTIYLTNSLILTLFAHQPADDASLGDIVDEVMEQLPAIVKTRAFDGDNTAIRTYVEKAVYLIKHHPWEVNALVSMAGSLPLLADTFRNKQWAAALGATLSFSSAVVQFMPSSGRTGIINTAQIEDKIAESAPARAIAALAPEWLTQHELFGALQGMASRFVGWVREHKYKISGALGLSAYAGYFMSGTQGEQKDSGLTRASIFYMLGSGAQALALEKPGYALGDVSFAVAGAMEEIETKIQNGTLDTSTPEATKATLVDVAHILSNRPEIMHDPATLLAAINKTRAMLGVEAQAELSTVPDDFIRKHANSEAKLSKLKHSPFLPAVASEEAAKATSVSPYNA